MKAKQLRDSILQMAIQGKLVPQDPNDEPASELLKKIKAEKEQLIKDKKIKKDKNESTIFRGKDGLFYETIGNETKCIQEEIPFEIPDSWELTRLGSLVEIKSSKRVFEKDYVPNGIPFFRSKEIGDLSRNENIETNLYISCDLYNELKEKYGVPNKGDILVTSVGSIGNTWICDDREFYYKDGNITQICMLDNLCTFYVDMFLHSDFFKYQVSSTVAGTAYNALTIIKLKNVIMPLPPLSEQKRIVEEIEKLLPLVDDYGKNEEALSKLQKEFPNRLRKSILQEAIQGKLVSQDPNDEPASELLKKIKAEKEQLIKDKKIKKDKNESTIFRGKDGLFYETIGNETKCIQEEIPFEIPDSWEWCRLQNIFDIRDGTHDSPKFVVDGIPFVTSKNISNGFLDFANIKYISEEDSKKFNARSNVDDGDILFAMIGSIGNPVIVKKDREFSIKNVALFKKYKEIDILFYLYYFLKYQQNVLRLEAIGAVQTFVSLSKIRNILFPLPPLAEQKRIVEEIEKIYSKVDLFDK